jgi:hypothetical protein
MKKLELVERAEEKLKIALDAFLEAQRKCKGSDDEVLSELEACHDHILKAAQHTMNVRALIE